MRYLDPSSLLCFAIHIFFSYFLHREFDPIPGSIIFAACNTLQHTEAQHLSLLCILFDFSTLYILSTFQHCVFYQLFSTVYFVRLLDRFVGKYSVRREGHHHYYWLLQFSEENQHLLHKQPLQSFKMFHIKIILGLHFSSVEYLREAPF